MNRANEPSALGAEHLPAVAKPLISESALKAILAVAGVLAVFAVRHFLLRAAWKESGAAAAAEESFKEWRFTDQ